VRKVVDRVCRLAGAVGQPVLLRVEKKRVVVRLKGHPVCGCIGGPDGAGVQAGRADRLRKEGIVLYPEKEKAARWPGNRSDGYSRDRFVDEEVTAV
jgi:hypothetical protein